MIDLTRWHDPHPDLSWILALNQGLNLLIALGGAMVLMTVMRQTKRGE